MDNLNRNIQEPTNSTPRQYPVPPNPVETIALPTLPRKTPWLIILLLVAIAAIAASSYFYLQTNSLKQQLAIAPSTTPSPAASVDPTAGWQTYNNEKLGG